jgi:ribonuclease HI
MKYHVISTSERPAGYGAIFTNATEAKEYQKKHPGSVYQVFDRFPTGIPPIPTKTATKKAGPSAGGITVYTDGSALGNPGPGGYGVVIQVDGKTHEFSQGYQHTTNNRMEMMAVITALENLRDNPKATIKVHSDSQYVINGITKGWAKGWRKRSWKKSDGKPALNPDLWGLMLDLVDLFPKLTFKWVRGHAGNVLNERADTLATTAASPGGNKLVDNGGNRPDPVGSGRCDAGVSPGTEKCGKVYNR